MILRKMLNSYVLAGVICIPVVAAAGTPQVLDTTDPAAPGPPRGLRVENGTLVATEPPAGTAATAPGELLAMPGEAGLPEKLTVAAPKGRRTVAESAMGAQDIPATALRAYQQAADILAEVKPSCELPWTLLAGIGRVESNHGRYGGATLGADGVSTPLIVGVPLNGIGPVAAIRDTDGGRWDNDTVWDRAVGPMQFIPSTWSAAGVDGDGDGVRSPNDIDDAALAAAVYLCAGSERITAPANMDAALHRYNNSDAYAALVMGYEKAYRTGDYNVVTPVGLTAPSADIALAKVPTAGTPPESNAKAKGKGSPRAVSKAAKKAAKAKLRAEKKQRAEIIEKVTAEAKKVVKTVAESGGTTEGISAPEPPPVEPAHVPVAVPVREETVDPTPEKSLPDPSPVVSPVLTPGVPRPSQPGTSTGGPSPKDTSTDGPATGGPSDGGSSTGAPTTGGPSKGGPSTGGPSTGGGSTDAPTTGGPATGGPSTGGSSSPTPPVLESPSPSPILDPTPSNEPQTDPQPQPESGASEPGPGAEPGAGQDPGPGPAPEPEVEACLTREEQAAAEQGTTDPAAPTGEQACPTGAAAATEPESSAGDQPAEQTPAD